MLIFVVRRLGTMIMTMVVVSILLFLLLEINSSSVAIKVLGPYTSEEQRNLWLEAHGYFRPIYVRYFDWLGHFLIGDFGDSTRFKVPVGQMLWPRLASTGILGLATMLVVIPLSLALGVLAGMREGSKLDRTISVSSIVTTSVPEFASAVVLSAFFVYYLDLLPGTSSMSDGFSLVQLILPAMVLVIYDFGYVTRMTRASMAEVMTAPYVRTAVLKGLPAHRVILRHALRNALIPFVTVVALQVPSLFTGAVITEAVFGWPGMGSLFLDGIEKGDYPRTMGILVIASTLIVLFNLLADVLYGVLDPRIRYR